MVTGREAGAFMGTDFSTSRSISRTLRPDYCQWPTLGLTRIPRNSSSHLRRSHIWIGSAWCSDEW